MTEYREFHCPYGDDFEGGDECDRCEQYELCMETPSADVIERYKLNKAIEEIEKIDLIVHDGINHYYKDGEEVIAEVLEILKRNIGE